MKRFVYIFNTISEIIISAKNSGSSNNLELYNYYLKLLLPYIDFKQNKNLYEIKYEMLSKIKKTLSKHLNYILDKRDLLPLSSELTDWKGRFTEEQMFITKVIFDKEYKLFKGGIDNEIFWICNFMELIDHSTKNKINLYIYFNEKIININRVKKLIIKINND